jgi:hypothetical protein
LPSRNGKFTRRPSGAASPSSIAADEVGIALGRGLERGVESRPPEQDPRQLRGEIGLTAALLGLLGALAREVADATGCGAHDDECQERDPVARVGEREPTDRRQVEVVERQRAHNRRRQPEQGTPVDRDSDDDKQVDDPQRDHGREMLERIDHERRQRRPASGDEHTERAGGPLTAQHQRLGSHPFIFLRRRGDGGALLRLGVDLLAAVGVDEADGDRRAGLGSREHQLIGSPPDDHREIVEAKDLGRDVLAIAVSRTGRGVYFCQIAHTGVLSVM